jgi:surfeit locus 1 family protein
MKRAVAVVAASLLFCGLLALGTWQIHRRTWKLDLIARVEQRVNAPAVSAPGPAAWPQVSAQTQEYRRVSATGTLLNRLATPVQAVTEFGPGYWIMTPLRLPDGSILLINRGFIAADRWAGIAAGAEGADIPATITGLLRLSEPGGGFLRRNDPAANRWYSRDVRAIAAARGLRHVAPYFIDADRASSPGADSHSPMGGLTVISFPNNHLLYAITWFALALMIPVAMGAARRAGR